MRSDTLVSEMENATMRQCDHVTKVKISLLFAQNQPRRNIENMWLGLLGLVVRLNMLYFGRIKAVTKLEDTCSIVISVPVYMCVDGEQGLLHSVISRF